jgi:hypothetical protein
MSATRTDAAGPLSTAQPPGAALTPLLWAASLGALALSLAFTGFAFGIGNNVFHIPLALRWFDAPDLANDAFTQSLRHFRSGVWMVMQWLTSPETLERDVHLAHVLSRAMAVVALALWQARLLGTPRLAALALLATVCSPWMSGSSPIGDHGLFIGYFSHSEVTWGPLLGALLAMQSRRWLLAGLCAGICFAINAFVGIWLLAVLAALWWQAGAEAWRPAPVARLAAGWLLAATPVLIAIGQTLHGAVVDFDYLAYIRLYYPDHFLAEAIDRRKAVQFGLLLAGGWLATTALPAPRFWRTTLLVPLAVFAVGLVLPYAWPTRLVFNLHLLRIDGVIQFLSVVLMIAAGMALAAQAREPVRAVLGLLVLLGLLDGVREPMELMFAVAALGLAALTAQAPWASNATLRRITPWAVAVLALAMLGFDLWSRAGGVLHALRWLALPVFLGLWRRGEGARTLALALAVLIVAATHLHAAYHRPPKVPVTAQTRDLDALVTAVQAAPAGRVFLVPLDRSFEPFFWRTRHPVWVDWKQGAAAMWAPAFHAQWIARYTAERALPAQAAAWGDYARAQGLSELVLPIAAGACPAGFAQRWQGEVYRWCEGSP